MHESAGTVHNKIESVDYEGIDFSGRNIIVLFSRQVFNVSIPLCIFLQY